MLFNSVHFLVFLPIVLGVYFFLPKNSQVQRWWLFLASLYFYAIFRVPYLILLVYCFTMTYYVVGWMHKAEGKRAKIFFLNVAIWGNLAVLYFFKYIDFSFTAWNRILQLNPCDAMYAHPTGVILPMGISFFCLIAVAYAVEVYKKETEPAKSLFQFGLFLSIFAHLVAGPFIRAKDCLSQFLTSKGYDRENFEMGMRQVLLGFFKKTLVADPISEAIDPIFTNPGDYNWISQWMSAYLFSIQVYCDFSGYSDIAIGCARILGYYFPKNFDRPLLAGTLTEFWRRWHISFSSWLRDYIYIPLGGNKVSVPRAYFNVFITMFASGIWHGADWNYVFWGTCHSVIIVLERFLFGFKGFKAAYEKIPRVLQPIYPVSVFSFSMFFFRAKPTVGFDTALDTAFFMIHRAVTGAGGIQVVLPLSLFVLLAILFGTDIAREKGDNVFDPVFKRKWVLYSMTAATLIVCLTIYSVTVSQPFVYFQF